MSVLPLKSFAAEAVECPFPWNVFLWVQHLDAGTHTASPMGHLHPIHLTGLRLLHLVSRFLRSLICSVGSFLSPVGTTHS